MGIVRYLAKIELPSRIPHPLPASSPFRESKGEQQQLYRRFANCFFYVLLGALGSTDLMFANTWTVCLLPRGLFPLFPCHHLNILKSDSLGRNLYITTSFPNGSRSQPAGEHLCPGSPTGPPSNLLHFPQPTQMLNFSSFQDPDSLSSTLLPSNIFSHPQISFSTVYRDNMPYYIFLQNPQLNSSLGIVSPNNPNLTLNFNALVLLNQMTSNHFHLENHSACLVTSRL